MQLLHKSLLSKQYSPYAVYLIVTKDKNKYTLSTLKRNQQRKVTDHTDYNIILSHYNSIIERGVKYYARQCYIPKQLQTN